MKVISVDLEINDWSRDQWLSNFVKIIWRLSLFPGKVDNSTNQSGVCRIPNFKFCAIFDIHKTA